MKKLTTTLILLFSIIQLSNAKSTTLKTIDVSCDQHASFNYPASYISFSQEQVLGVSKEEFIPSYELWFEPRNPEIFATSEQQVISLITDEEYDTLTVVPTSAAWQGFIKKDQIKPGLKFIFKTYEQGKNHPVAGYKVNLVDLTECSFKMKYMKIEI